MDLEQLLAEREITRGLIAFARAMDERDYGTMSALVTPDVHADFGVGGIDGRQAVVDFIASFLDNCGTTQHILGNILIEIDGDTATSEAYVSDMHLSSDPASDISFRTLGNYSDTWVKQDGAWLIARRIKDNRAAVGSMDVFDAD
ncbi:MAG: nuclear transport factor 2 family protein [Pseudomonadota bacterium]